ncbi:MAG: 50S ribosomal protein L24 [Patescibacteria group bacterium]
MKIRKNDKVKIIAGKDKGKTGKVIKILSQSGRILVEGLNLYKKHVRPKKQGEKGETVLTPRSIQASNAMIICSSCARAVKVGHSIEGDIKTRICKKCGVKI